MAPTRIVSLVPSLTELLFALGAGASVVGRTRFCTEPAEAARVPSVGGTKNPNVARIVALQPDLVIANKEENRREDVDELRSAGLDVLVTDPNSVDEALAMIAGIGALLGHPGEASVIIADVHAALAEPSHGGQPRVFVAVWKQPFLGLGCASYGHDLLERAGAVNVLGGRPRYPEVTTAEVAALNPSLILLPAEPYPFKDSDVAEYGRIAPARIIDGRLLWWYGPRIPDAVRALRAIFAESRHPP